MPKLKRLSQKEVIKILEGFGFIVAKQRGSHIKMRRETDFGFQILTVPNHRDIDRGTLKAIFNQTSKFVSEDELRDKFYTK
ncbi:MAG: type II toxin-antitoxin system HicA family toxin [Candidatus Vogelbacteria bacterium]|nr:type II toxin-antitoxin system HicA family toxin [Candidatus Vogelbacteria bacterium]